MNTSFPKLLLPAILLASFIVNAQNDNIQRLDSFSGEFIKKIRSVESEKAWLVSNKSIYTAGERLWFRAFLLHAFSNKISVQSKLLFVDLVNIKDNVVARSLMNPQKQQWNGMITLPDTIATGYYWLRAYTGSMATKDSNNAAILPLYIINPASPSFTNPDKKNNSITNSLQPQLDIFPEGGNLITGINTSVGFYLHDAEGNPLIGTIKIKDNHDTVVSVASTSENGLSKAEFFPYYYRKYKAVASVNDKEYSFPLPAFNRFAAQLAVTGDNSSILQLRTVLEDSIFNADAPTYVIGISRDSLCFAAVGYGSYETNIPKAKFPQGIATFLLFDRDFSLMSERSVYIKESVINLKTLLNKTTFTKRSKVVLTASVLNKNAIPVPASITITVADSNVIASNNSQSVASLIRESKYGSINDWNILHLNNVTERDIDNLMFCKPSFYETLNKESGPKDNNSLNDIFNIKGRIVDKQNTPLANRALSLVYKGEDNIITSVTTDNEGRFDFPVSGYIDSTQFIIQMTNLKGKKEIPKIVLEGFPYPHFQTPLHLKKRLELSSPVRSAYLKHYADTNYTTNGILKPVQVNAKSKTYYDRTGRMSSNTSVLTSEQLLRLGMGNLGIGILRLPGVQLINGFVSMMYGPDDMNGINSASEPLILLDGVQMSGPVLQFLNTLDPRQIEFIEVFKGTEASMFGLRGGKGVIYIHSSGDIKQDFSLNDNTGIYKFYRPGYSKPAVFPAISYSDKESKDFSFKDSRSTLYWNGNEITDNKGNLNFTFFTSDIQRVYKVTLTGITVHGDLIYETISFPNL
ncbi:MAG: TonB-dependent receptor plug domain-containing protein [Flavisolibacter sp.]